MGTLTHSEGRPAGIGRPVIPACHRFPAGAGVHIVRICLQVSHRSRVAHLPLQSLLLQVPDVESVEDRPLEGLVVAVAADVTTSTKAALSWERPFNPATRPLTVSELYWTDPGLLGLRCCASGVHHSSL